MAWNTYLRVHGRPRLISCAAAAAVAVALVGCGGSSVSSGSSSADTGLAGAAGGPLTAADVATAHRFVGGGLGRATGSPIVIGLVGINGGSIPFLPGDNTVNAAVRLINDRLDGIDGHPLVLQTCQAAGSDQAALQCGEKFRNDPAVKAIINPGLGDNGVQLLGAIGGSKPEFCDLPGNAELFGTNVFCPSGGVEAANAAITYLQKHGTGKTIAQILPDTNTFRALASVFVKQMAASGLQATEGLVPIASPDVLSAVVASGAQHAGGIFLTLTGPSECISVAKALKTLNVPATIPIVALSTCIDPSVIKALGDLPHWTYLDIANSPYLSPKDAQTKVFLDANHAYGQIPPGAFTQMLFGTTLWMAKVFKQIGASGLTTATIAAKAKQFSGPMFMGDPHIRFGAQPFPNLGSLSARFYTYKGGGRWSDATGGSWVDSPPPT